jgi:sugar phosphate isomerase/epimerase
MRNSRTRLGSTAPPGSGLAFSTLGSPGASVAEIVAIARRGGCRGIELRSASGEVVNADLVPAEVLQTREQLVSAGIAVLAIGSYVRLCAPVLENGVDEQLEDLLAQLELAARIGASGVRVFMGDESIRRTEGPSDGERLALRRLSAVRKHCPQLDVSVLIETHDSHSLGARLSEFCELLDEQVPEHQCGVIWDTAHSWSQGESPFDTLRLLGPWLAYLQIKDIRSRAEPEPVMPGGGSYPIAELAETLKRSGWKGWISLEWERMWHPDLPSIDIALAETRRWARGLSDEMGTEQL